MFTYRLWRIAQRWRPDRPASPWPCTRSSGRPTEGGDGKRGQRVCFGERVGKRRDWFFEQVEDRPLGGVPKRLRQSFKLVPGSIRKTENPVTH